MGGPIGSHMVLVDVGRLRDAAARLSYVPR